jgi:hypothetical protein
MLLGISRCSGLWTWVTFQDLYPKDFKSAFTGSWCVYSTRHMAIKMFMAQTRNNFWD